MVLRTSPPTYSSSVSVAFSSSMSVSAKQSGVDLSPGKEFIGAVIVLWYHPQLAEVQKILLSDSGSLPPQWRGRCLLKDVCLPSSACSLDFQLLETICDPVLEEQCFWVILQTVKLLDSPPVHPVPLHVCFYVVKTWSGHFLFFEVPVVFMVQWYDNIGCSSLSSLDDSVPLDWVENHLQSV